MVTAMLAAAPAAGPARAVVAAVPDPELPVVTIEDLGILRDVRVEDVGNVVVEITPTYSGCPAMDSIRADVLARLREHGYDDAEVRLVLSPAWTTDWITDTGRATLREHGIAPPHPAGPVALTLSVRCPLCGSPDTREISRFGSTACKSLWTCRVCLEPFDHVKAL
ncbi:MAG: 1,2-phenylacetyl-CoA epoxidase subunit PaaD [Jiangellaceae bacterium]